MIPVGAVSALAQVNLAVLNPHPRVFLRQNAADAHDIGIFFNVMPVKYVFCDAEGLLAFLCGEAGVLVVILKFLDGLCHVAVAFTV